MAINLKVAKRYSKGLFDFALESKQETLVYQEMKSLQNTILVSKELRNFLNNPILDPKRKLKVASEIFAKFDKITKTFIDLVIKHKREGNLLEITRSYQNLYEYNNNITKVSLITATELDEVTLDSIYKKSKLIPANAKIILNHKIDSTLVGGFILQVGDNQIDTSIKSKLASMRKEFEVNHYISKY